MTWLATQVWFLMLTAFLAGAVVAYLVLRRLLPHVDRIEIYPSEQEGESRWAG
jgi:hypothetical protein